MKFGKFPGKIMITFYASHSCMMYNRNKCIPSVETEEECVTDV